MPRTALALAALLACAAPLAGQTIRGRVIDARTGEGVAQAAVAAETVEGRGAGQARSDAGGTFVLPLRAAGAVRLRVQRTGYHPALSDTLPVAVRETIDVVVSVSTEALAIAPLRVTARVEPAHRRALELNGFYDRERRGLGKFVRREDFDQRADRDLAQTLSRVQGAAILHVGAHQYIYFPRNGVPVVPQTERSRGTNNTRPARGAPPSSSATCIPRVWVDGARVTYDAQSDINSVVSPNQVEAIEVYRGPSEIPVQYAGSDAQCGVILIWTRQES